MKKLSRPWVLGILAILVFQVGCADEKSMPPIIVPVNDYVGAAVCAGCHADIAASHRASGHSHILTPVVQGVRPGDPLLLPDNPPAGRTWADLAYVVGGFGWRALFVTPDSQLVVGLAAQYNIPTDQFLEPAWADYHSGGLTVYDYDCFRCHTTGPSRADGTFRQPGVQCEACHGMGKFHRDSPQASNILRDDSAPACGRCHGNGSTDGRILATGTFIDYHQQYNEMRQGPHEELKCVDCHSPHAGVRRAQVGGRVKECTACHANMTVTHLTVPGDPAFPTCVDCHLPRASLNARAVNKYRGDERTHIFKVHDGPEGQADMFEEQSGSTYVKDEYGVTLDFACYSCHKDEQGVGGSASTRTLAQLYAKAQTIHEDKARLAR